MAIEKIGVVGAGVMGAGIAAHVANAGIPVVLLDLVPGGAAKAVERMLRTDPAPFMSRAAARLVDAGDLGTDIGKLADCDWIIEAIIEKPEAKRELYAKLETLRKPGSIVSSNTSTIPLADLTQGLPASFAADFMVTHDVPAGVDVPGLDDRLWIKSALRDAYQHREGLRTVVEAVRPAKLWHGHMHVAYSREIQHDGWTCVVQGLGADVNGLADNMVLIDPANP